MLAPWGREQDTTTTTFLMSDVVPKPAFKKPTKKRSERKEETVPQELETTSTDDATTSAVLEDLKALRSANKTRLSKGIVASTSDDLNDDYERGYEDNVVSMALQQAFTQSSTNEKDIHLEKYIQDHLPDELKSLVKSAVGFEMGTGEAEKAKIQQQKVVQELYAIPEHLAVDVKPPEVQKSTEPSTNFATIVEVELPVDYKFKNIEETEIARRKFEEQREAQRLMPKSFVPSHKRYREDRPINRDPDAATDEIAFQRFKKRQRFR